MAVEEHDGLRKASLGHLLRRLSDQIGMLVRQEVDLAKAEVAEKAREGGRAAGLFGAAAAAGLCALGALTALVILALSEAIPPWAAALVALALFAAAAAAFALAGRNRLRQATPPVPEQAIDSTKEDIEWAKTRLRSGRT